MEIHFPWASPQFSAVPYEGYEFLHWEDESGNILSLPQLTTLQITGFSELLAIFQQLVHEIQVTAMPTGKGIVEWLEKAEKTLQIKSFMEKPYPSSLAPSMGMFLKNGRVHPVKYIRSVSPRLKLK